MSVDAIGDSGAECELCGGVADVLHMVSGECSCVPAGTRSRHCEGAAAALLHAAAALPTPPAEGPDDSKGGRAPRPRKAGPAAAPAGDGWFRFSSAHSDSAALIGCCKWSQARRRTRTSRHGWRWLSPERDRQLRRRERS